MVSKKYLLILVAFILVTTLQAQTPKPLLYKSSRELPPYLKLVKSHEDLNKNRVIKISKKSNLVTINRKKPIDNIFIKVPNLFAEGMNPELAIPASLFVKDKNGRLALLTNELYPKKQRVIYPVKVTSGYSFLITAPVNIVEYNHAVLQTSWKATVNSDGTFYLASNIFGGRLGVAGNEVTMMTEAENTKTKFIAYQRSRCNTEAIWLYNPASKTILGRSITGGTVKFIAVAISEALQSRIAGGVEIKWDFTAFKSYQSSAYRSFPSYFEFKKETTSSDGDGDGADAVECGGSDCNDADGNIYPSSPELCDGEGKDEDCDNRTFQQRDADGDGYYDAACFNVDATGKITSQGTDCDDTNPAIIPGAVKYISETQVEICGLGTYSIEPGMRAIRQPNGTAIVIPR